jgi:hypothetical protein
MANDDLAPDTPLAARRPIEFRSTTEEAAVGSVMGGMLGSLGAAFVGGLVGAIGATIGQRCGGWSMLGGTLAVWGMVWVLPVSILLARRPVWRFLAVVAAGALYPALLVWFIGHRDLGTFYPWVLAALPLGIVLGVVSEPVRLAHGGSTEQCARRGLILAGGVAFYGNHNAAFLVVGYMLGLVGEVLSLGHERPGAAIAGLLGGGAVALAVSSLVAWRGDTAVAEWFFGSKWNIAWAGAAVGAMAGAIGGWRAASIRERQRQRHQQLH